MCWYKFWLAHTCRMDRSEHHQLGERQSGPKWQPKKETNILSTFEHRDMNKQMPREGVCLQRASNLWGPSLAEWHGLPHVGKKNDLTSSHLRFWYKDCSHNERPATQHTRKRTPPSGFDHLFLTHAYSQSSTRPSNLIWYSQPSPGSSSLISHPAFAAR